MSLVRPLFEGPVDVVGDTHGEIQAIHDLLAHLGYHNDGNHPQGRRLVFVGDLTDRGPDSPAVVNLVQRLVETGLAQCVLGNHDLNLLLGEEKYDNNWFYGREFLFEGTVVPQRMLHDDESRRKITDFFASLPLALERPGLRVVHACWHNESVELARQASDVVELYRHHVRLIEECITVRDLDQIDRELEFQNRNPVKMLTSGPERRVADPFESSGKIRHEERVPWWEDYTDSDFCVYGHYGAPPGQPHGRGRAVCIDYAVAKRWRERLYRDFRGKFKGKLASIRFPEKLIVFDDGSSLEFQG